MGTPKQLLMVEGRPLIVRAAEAVLASPAWPVVVVLGAHSGQIRPVLARLPVLIVENPAWTEGVASSIRTGITALRQFSRMVDAAAFVLCDQPALSAETITRLAAAQRSSGRTIAAASYGGRNGAPALFLRKHFPALAALTGDEGARNLLNGAGGQVAAVEMPEFAADLDTPADYDPFKAASL